MLELSYWFQLWHGDSYNSMVYIITKKSIAGRSERHNFAIGLVDFRVRLRYNNVKHIFKNNLRELYNERIVDWKVSAQ